MTDLDQLDVGTLTSLTNGEKKRFRERVKEMDLTLDDLKALKEAETSGKNRKELLQFLDDQITAENVGTYLNIAERDIGEVQNLVNEIERVEDIEHLEEEKIEVEQDDLIDLMGGTVSEMKEFINRKPLTAEQLENILNAEGRIKDRKTAKEFLERQIKKQKVAKDIEEAQGDIEKLGNDLEEIRTDENKVTDQKASNKDNNNEKSENNQQDEDKQTQKNEEESENKAQEDKSSSEEKESDKSDEEDTKDSKDTSDEKAETKNSKKDQDDSKLNKKQEIVEELDLKMSDDEIKDVSLEQLRSIKSEKEHREHLIEELKGSGMDKDNLREASTSDLEKLKENIDSGNEESSQEEHKEMREEAEEDLEMLMGAVRSEEENNEESSKNTKEKLEDLKQSISEKLDRSNSEKNNKSSGGINAENVQEVLDQYRELDNVEASVKTAHIMKGFLENKLGIEREMTYKELADKMPVEDDKAIKELAEFFIKMHKEQYTGRLTVDDSDEIINTCTTVVEKLG